MDQKEQEVWECVQAMNRCWTCSRPQELERLNDYFHETMVAITPVDCLRLEGRQACIAGWSGFARSVRIHSWVENEPKIMLYNDTAVVTYYFDMAFDMQGQKIQMGGRDMLTLIKENGKWQVVADQFSSYPVEFSTR